MSLALLATAAAAAPDEKAFNQSVSALERAHAAYPDPSILLALASVHEAREGHCGPAIDAYRRYFETCADCGSLDYAVNRMRTTLTTCATSLSGPYATCGELDLVGVLSQDGDVSPREVVALIYYHYAAVEPDTARALARKLRAIGGGRAPQAELQTLRARARGKLLHHQGVLRAQWMIERARGLRGSFEQLVAILADADRGDQTSPTPATCPLTTVLAERLPAAHRSERWGQMTISTSPYTDVYVDGLRVGQTPLARVDVTAGAHHVRAVNPETKQALDAKVIIEPNVNSRYRVTLQGDHLALSDAIDEPGSRARNEAFIR